MYLPLIDKKINKLVKLYQTRNPFRIARELKILVLEEDLGEIYGYYSKLKQIKMIHINSNENTPMLSKKTLVSELKIEKEANYFATHLTIDPTLDGFDHMTKYEKLVCFGLPDEFDRYL